MESEKKVYLIWYKCDFGTSLWGVCDNLETVQRIVERIKQNFDYDVDYTDETILEG